MGEETDGRSETLSCLQGEKLKACLGMQGDLCSVEQGCETLCIKQRVVPASWAGQLIPTPTLTCLSVCVCTDLHRDPRVSASSEAVTDTEI